MVETTVPSLNAIAPSAKPALINPTAAKIETVNPDGSAIPDVIAYHHRPEDLDDQSNQDVPDSSGTENSFFGADGLTFSDFLDVINPLQHIPIVSTVYRAMTDDEISPGARVAGGALYGGPIGLAVAAANAIVESTTGEDIGETLMAAFTGNSAAAKPIAKTETVPKDKVVSVAEAGPIVFGSGAKPIGITAPQRLSVESTTADTKAKALSRRPAEKLPYGGMGALPFGPIARNDESRNDPVAALLQARATVPLAGPVPGLGNKVRPTGPEQSPLPKISHKLSNTLSALAAQTAPSHTTSPRNGAATPQTAAPLPAALVPQRMFDALDRYEQMKKSKTVDR